MNKIKLAESEKNKGNEALKANDLKEALDYYTSSIAHDPSVSATYCNRALIHLKLKQFDKAIADANSALKINPDYAKAYFRRGKAYMELKQYVNAVLDFQRILIDDSSDKEATSMLKEARQRLTP